MFNFGLAEYLADFSQRKSKGSALVISVFLALVTFLIIASMMNISMSNTTQVNNDREGRIAYYAAESGVSEVTNFFNATFINWGKTLTDSTLPTQSSPETLSNGASYWIESLYYIDLNKTAVIDVIGNYKGAYRKIRARINTSIPKYFDDYGLLTNGVLTINGNKTLYMSIHANDGLILSGPTNMEDGSVATQSLDEGASSPDPVTNPVGGYVSPVDVPLVPINDLRTLTQGGIVLDINQPDLNTQIANAPAGSYIYIGKNLTHSGTNQTVTLTGDMQSKIIFIDQDASINQNSLSNLSNAFIVSSGSLTINGTVDFNTSHSGKIDLVFASDENMTLNGSKRFEALFWTNGSFTQNGSSVAGRVITQDGISFNGSFSLQTSNKLFDYGTFDNVAQVSTWQQVAMD